MPVRITFYAHASFRLEADGLSVVTDPYTPGPEGSNFDPIDEPADLVIMSSATDSFHSDPSPARGAPPAARPPPPARPPSRPDTRAGGPPHNPPGHRLLPLRPEPRAGRPHGGQRPRAT